MNRYWVVYFIVVGWSVAAFSKEIEVGTSRAVTSFSQALAEARPFDTLRIDPGTYSPDSTLVIRKPVTIIGRGEVELIAPLKMGLIEIRADSVNLECLHFKDVPLSYTKDLAAVWVDRVRHFRIVENQFTNCFFAIYASKSRTGEIRNNQIRGQAKEEHSSANAIHLWYCDSVKITGNLTERHRDGIYLEFTNHSRISNNISRNNLRYGLHFMFSHHNVYTHNTFQTNGAGVAVMFSDNIEMRHNLFTRNWGRASYGLLLKEIYDSRIVDNTFERNTMGIFAEGCSRVHFLANDFRQNGWAIRMRGSANDNELSYNNFRSNSFDLATDARENYNHYHHNYWDTYEGYDLDRDGVGDVPHRPVNLFSYLVSRIDESIILLRSSFIEVLNFAERMAPAVTPTNLIDEQPLMKPTSYDSLSEGI